jgi:hypothetical protein
MAVSRSSLERAVDNVAKHGDTDVFPFPLENHWFHDMPASVIGLLEEIDRDFDRWYGEYPVVFARLLAGVGYVGFRAATQIDAIWNCYLLALVIEIADELEAARIPADRNVVFSYRYRPDPTEATLFDRQLGWASYHGHVLATAPSFETVVSTDISDFYSRIYHHRLENALKQATTNTEVVRRIVAILTALSQGMSYGLPVGGHAARLLAELLLNRTDHLLLSSGVKFARFVDDYTLFARSREEAQAQLVSLSSALMLNEGLSLSRSKTRFMNSAECIRLSPVAPIAPGTPPEEAEARGFLRIRLRYDPYSPTRDEDYSKLATEIRKFDITKLLARELRKTRVDEAMVRQLVKAIRFIDQPVRDEAVLSLLQNIDVLYPVFPTVAILLKAVLQDLGDTARTKVFDTVRDLIRRKSHIILVPTNLAYALRLAAFDRSEETDASLIQIFGDSSVDPLLRRDVILAMARRRVDYWLSHVVRRFAILSPWEKRSLIVASYVLGDEGRHWRDGIRRQLSLVDLRFMEWVASKNNGRSWDIPL